MSTYRNPRTRVLLTLREDYVEAIDKLVTNGAAVSRSDLVERVIGAFLTDLTKQRQQQGALGALVGFFIVLLGAAVIAGLLGGDGK